MATWGRPSSLITSRSHLRQHTSILLQRDFKMNTKHADRPAEMRPVNVNINAPLLVTNDSKLQSHICTAKLLEFSPHFDEKKHPIYRLAIAVNPRHHPHATVRCLRMASARWTHVTSPHAHRSHVPPRPVARPIGKASQSAPFLSPAMTSRSSGSRRRTALHTRSTT